MSLSGRIFFVLSLFILAVASCTKPVILGSDFLDQEKADLKFSDDFSLTFYTEKSDSVLVHDDTIARQLVTYVCGSLNDPFFGKTKAEIYAQPILPTVATELLGATLDSVVLDLRYDTMGNYGDINQPITIEVYRMMERPDWLKNYYSNQSFLTSPDLLGSLTFTPRPKDSVTVITPEDTIKVAPRISIPLNIGLLNDLTTQDTIVYENQDSFLTYFNGLYIKMSIADNTLLGFNLVDAISGMSVYYKKLDTTEQEFRMIFTGLSVKTVHLENDYAGTMVGASLSPEPESDYFYVQGLSGVATKMQVDGLSNLGNVIINEAELEFYCSFPDGDNPAFFPPCPYIVTSYSNATPPDYSLDVTVALVRSSGDYHSLTYTTLFGGDLNQVADGPPAIYKYNMKVTSQIKDIFKGKTENIIYFNPIDKGNIPSRSIIYGPGNSLYPPRLRVFYTAI